MSDGDTRGPTASEDHALVRAVLDGKREALARLAERMRAIPRVLRALDRRSARRLGEAELSDLAQEVLVRVWPKLDEYQGLSTLEGWLYGFCLLEYRNARRRGERRRHEARVIAQHGVAEPTSSLDPDPWAFEEVHEGLRRIGREQAEVIRLKHFEERTFEEIGAVLGISPSTVKARYYRGMEELRPLLEDEPEEKESEA